MKRVFFSDSLAEAGHVRNVLEHAGIGCFVKHEQLSGGLGEVPFLECTPEVWVYADADADRARRIVSDMTDAPESGDPWRCASCGETIDGHYAACWRCGASDDRDADETPG